MEQPTLAKARQRSTSFCWPCDRWKKFWPDRIGGGFGAPEAAFAPCVGGGGVTRSCSPSRSIQRRAYRSCSIDGVSYRPMVSKKPEQTTSHVDTHSGLRKAVRTAGSA